MRKLEYKLLVAEGLSQGQIGRIDGISRAGVWAVIHREKCDALKKKWLDTEAGREAARKSARRKSKQLRMNDSELINYRWRLYSCGIKGQEHKEAVASYLKAKGISP